MHMLWGKGRVKYKYVAQPFLVAQSRTWVALCRMKGAGEAGKKWEAASVQSEDDAQGGQKCVADSVSGVHRHMRKEPGLEGLKRSS